MEFDPPIASRTTDELVEIANYPEKWSSSAVEQANKELQKREVTIEYQQQKVEEWNRLIKEESDKELEERRTEAYDIFELFSMAFKLPYTILFDWYLKKEGYHLKHRQRLISILTGIALYACILFWVNYSSNKNQIDWQKEVDNTDISEWEREYYGEEKYIEFRKESIEMVERIVKESIAAKEPIYVILEGDTIPNEQVKQLRKLDPSNIKDVVIEGDFEPEPHQIIIIKLVKPETITTKTIQ